jgi:hypothetical protein
MGGVEAYLHAFLTSALGGGDKWLKEVCQGNALFVDDVVSPAEGSK